MFALIPPLKDVGFPAHIVKTELNGTNPSKEIRRELALLSHPRMVTGYHSVRGANETVYEIGAKCNSEVGRAEAEVALTRSPFGVHLWHKFVLPLGSITGATERRQTGTICSAVKSQNDAGEIVRSKEPTMHQVERRLPGVRAMYPAFATNPKMFDIVMTMLMEFNGMGRIRVGAGMSPPVAGEEAVELNHAARESFPQTGIVGGPF